MKKKLHTAFIALCITLISNIAGAQSQVYFREGFNVGEGDIGSTNTGSVPGQYFTQTNSGTWYGYGVYRSNGPTGSCATETGGLSHIRFANLTAITSATDSAYLITPIASAGVNTISFLAGRANRRMTIWSTPDTLATTTNWTQIISTTNSNTACQLFEIIVNDAAARRIKIEARGGTDSDIDSVVLTSVNQIMPVTFAGVSATATSGKVKVSWDIATEVNTLKYVIERSADGSSFAEVGALPANASPSYTWMDNSPSSVNNFYRIKAVDKDGKIMYTSIMKVNLSLKNTEITIAPNPVTGSLINLQVGNLKKGSYFINLYNPVGQKVYSRSFVHPGGSSTHPIQLQSLKPGIYNLQFHNGESVISKKVVVR